MFLFFTSVIVIGSDRLSIFGDKSLWLWYTVRILPPLLLSFGLAEFRWRVAFESYYESTVNTTLDDTTGPDVSGFVKLANTTLLVGIMMSPTMTLARVARGSVKDAYRVEYCCSGLCSKFSSNSTSTTVTVTTVKSESDTRESDSKNGSDSKNSQPKNDTTNMGVQSEIESQKFPIYSQAKQIDSLTFCQRFLAGLLLVCCFGGVAFPTYVLRADVLLVGASSESDSLRQNLRGVFYSIARTLIHWYHVEGMTILNCPEMKLYNMGCLYAIESFLVPVLVAKCRTWFDFFVFSFMHFGSFAVRLCLTFPLVPRGIRKTWGFEKFRRNYNTLRMAPPRGLDKTAFRSFYEHQRSKLGSWGGVMYCVLYPLLAPANSDSDSAVTLSTGSQDPTVTDPAPIISTHNNVLFPFLYPHGELSLHFIMVLTGQEFLQDLITSRLHKKYLPEFTFSRYLGRWDSWQTRRTILIWEIPALLTTMGLAMIGFSLQLEEREY